MGYIINFINIVIQLFTLLVIIKVFLSYFMAPYHPVRMYIDRIVEPLLRPIRQFVPPIGMMDISPIVLIILLQIVDRLLISIFSRLFL